MSDKPFVKPTLEEVAAYCAERNKGIDPVLFFHHYEANGWKIGKASMKNWKAAVITWERQRASEVGGAEAFKKRMDKRDPALVHLDKLRAEFEASQAARAEALKKK